MCYFLYQKWQVNHIPFYYLIKLTFDLENETHTSDLDGPLPHTNHLKLTQFMACETFSKSKGKLWGIVNTASAVFLLFP